MIVTKKTPEPNKKLKRLKDLDTGAVFGPAMGSFDRYLKLDNGTYLGLNTGYFERLTTGFDLSSLVFEYAAELIIGGDPIA